MHRKRVRIAIDAAMALVYVAVMATALVQEAPHEYLGIALFVLVVAHIVANRRWFVALARGRYTALRTAQLVVVAALLACVIAQFASSLVLSKHAFWFLPALPGAALARRVHMLGAYWGFVFAFAHVGLQSRAVLARMGWGRSHSPLARRACRAVLAVFVCYGAWSFVALGLPAYLTGQVQFAYADYATPLGAMYARYMSIAVLVAGAFNLLARLLRAHDKRGSSRNSLSEGGSRRTAVLEDSPAPGQASSDHQNGRRT